MMETLKRLQDLQRRLEQLHEETATVLSESQRLMSQVEREANMAASAAREKAPQAVRPRAKRR